MLDDLTQAQAGVLTRAQILAGGFTKSAIEVRLRSGRWQGVLPGVYVTFSGPVPRASQLWAAVLRAGPGAALSHQTAAELIGLTDTISPTIHVTVPVDRTPSPISGVTLHRSVRIGQCRHPTRLPPQTRIEETVVDLTQTCPRSEDAIGWLARAVGFRLTTTERLTEAIQARLKLRHRELLLSTLDDVASGCHSLLEVRYLREVERAHRLPRGERQVHDGGPGRSRYDDVRYRELRTRVELDGRAAHPEHDRWRDMRRDNAAVLQGDQVLRYGPADVDEAPCRVAEQVGLVLRSAGWTGRPRRCRRADCLFPRRRTG